MTDPIEAITKDVRELLIEQRGMRERVNSIEQVGKETRDSLNQIMNQTLRQMDSRIDAIERRPIYTPLAQQQQQEIDMWFSRLKEIYTGYTFAKWLIPLTLVLISGAIGILTYVNGG